MHQNNATGNIYTYEAGADLRARLAAAIDSQAGRAGQGRGSWARANGFDPADLSRFLSGRKDWTLAKTLHLINKLGGELYLYFDGVAFGVSFA